MLLLSNCRGLLFHFLALRLRILATKSRHIETWTHLSYIVLFLPCSLLLFLCFLNCMALRLWNLVRDWFLDLLTSWDNGLSCWVHLIFIFLDKLQNSLRHLRPVPFEFVLRCRVWSVFYDALLGCLKAVLVRFFDTSDELCSSLRVQWLPCERCLIADWLFFHNRASLCLFLMHFFKSS